MIFTRALDRFYSSSSSCFWPIKCQKNKNNSKIIIVSHCGQAEVTVLTFGLQVWKILPFWHWDFCWIVNNCSPMWGSFEDSSRLLHILTKCPKYYNSYNHPIIAVVSDLFGLWDRIKKCKVLRAIGQKYKFSLILEIKNI